MDENASTAGLSSWQKQVDAPQSLQFSLPSTGVNGRGLDILYEALYFNHTSLIARGLHIVKSRENELGNCSKMSIGLY